MKKFVIDNPAPFIVPIANWSGQTVQSADEPLPTVTCANRSELTLISHGRCGWPGVRRAPRISRPADRHAHDSQPPRCRIGLHRPGRARRGFRHKQTALPRGEQYMRADPSTSPSRSTCAATVSARRRWLRRRGPTIRGEWPNARRKPPNSHIAIAKAVTKASPVTAEGRQVTDC